MGRIEIDVDRVAGALEGWDQERLLALALELLDAVPKTRRAKVLERHLPLETIRRRSTRPGAVLEEVRAFHEDALDGRYFETFNVNSKNYMEKSKGTRKFIADFRRLGASVGTMTRAGAHAEAAEAYELLLDLHRRVDDVEDIIFLADEHGAWQVGFRWRQHVADWFAALAATRSPEAYAAKVLDIIAVLGSQEAEPMLAAARNAGSPAQRRSLRGAKVRKR